VAPRIGPGLVVVLGVVVLLASLYVLGVSGGGGDDEGEPPVAVETPTPTPDKPSTKERRRKRVASRPMRVSIVATGQVYVCMEDSRGRAVVDKETLEAGQRTKTFRGRRFKVTFGTAEARIRQNGKDYRVASSRDPVGYELRSGRRPQRITSGLAGCA
jgi:hypothetical protein